MYRRGLLSTVAFGSALAGCPDPEPTNGTPPEEETSPDERVEIADHRLARREEGTDEETVVIEGSVRIFEEGLEHVELRGQFFDADDELLDTTFERLQELDVGIEHFEIQYPDVGPAAAAVEGYAIEITTVI